MKKLSETAPNYIPIKQIIQSPLDYEWDREYPFSIISPSDEKTKTILKKLSYKSLVAYTIACSEWVIYRVSGEVNDLLPYYYLEAFWGYVMDYYELFEYPPELMHEDWLGQSKGPIDCAISSIMNVIYFCEDYEPPIDEAARIAQLAKHVLKDQDTFIDWESNILDRLINCCEIDMDDVFGRAIPRQMMDLSIRYEESGLDLLLKDNIDLERFNMNPFYIGGNDDKNG